MAADLEPNLSELTHIPTDENLGGGVPTPIIDNSHLVDQMNQNARFRAENVRQKYLQFLKNKTDLYKDVADIQQYDTLAEDEPALKKQAADVLTDIMNNPSAAIGGRGYGELQTKIAKFRGDSMLSKQNNVDHKSDKSFLERNPEMQTDQNMNAVEKYPTIPLGQRKSVLLQTPTILDEKGLFEGALKSATHTTSEADGKGYIVQNKVVSPEAVQGDMGMALQTGKDKYNHSISSAVESNFKALPQDQQDHYNDLANQNNKDNPDKKTTALQEYWKQHTNDYLSAYIPDANYKKDKDGNYIIDTKTIADPNFRAQERLDLDRQKLAQKASSDRATLNLKWANYGLAKRKLDSADDVDLSGADNVIDEATSIIDKGTPLTINRGGNDKTETLRISDPTLLQTFGNVDKDGKTTNVPDAVDFDKKTNQLNLVYFGDSPSGSKFNTDPSESGGHHYIAKEIPIDQRTWLKHITKRSFPNKDIGKINALVNDALNKNGNSLFEIAQKKKESDGQSAATQPKDVTSTKKNQSYSVKGKSYSKADLNKLGYTDEMINKAIQLGNIKIK